MKRIVSIIGLAILWQVSVSWAQFAPVNEQGLAWGHLHLYPPDRQKEVMAWLALGGRLGFNLSGNTPILFPGILILINDLQPTNKTGQALGSAGSLIDHVGFKVQNLEESTTSWKGFVAWWKQGNWGLKVEPGSKPGQAFVTTPGGVKIEVIEDRSLQVPIAFDHAHFSVQQAGLPKIQDFYAKMFGATPLRGEANTLRMPGGNLIFSTTDVAPQPTIGRTLDHIGFNADSAPALAAFTKDVTAKGAKFYRPPRNSAFGQTALADEFGTFIEVNKGQRAYFDLKQIEPNTYLVDESGRTQAQAEAERR